MFKLKIGPYTPKAMRCLITPCLLIPNSDIQVLLNIRQEFEHIAIGYIIASGNNFHV